MFLTDDNSTLLSTVILFGCPVVGILAAIIETWNVSKVTLTTNYGTKATDPLNSEQYFVSIGNEDYLEKIIEISRHISEGARTFLHQEYIYMFVYILLGCAILGPFVDVPTMIAFAVGCLTSMLCGYLGMAIATYANSRTCQEACKGLPTAFLTALKAGSVMGYLLVSLGVLNLAALVYIYDMYYSATPTMMFEAIAGYGLGGSSIALFARVGGGIYTKAADVGADLSGKNEYGMNEDDPRNPACIADNVGDNVGDVAGMGADLFGSLAESTCAALVIAGSSTVTANAVHGLAHTWAGLMFPVCISSTGILIGIITSMFVQYYYPVNELHQIEKSLKQTLVISTILETPTVLLLAFFMLPVQFNLQNFGYATWWKAALAVLLGLWSGLIIGYVTEYYTSHSYTPVREISLTQRTSAATGIIYGLALGYQSTIVPVFCIGASVCVAHLISGMYGIALAALGMLSTLTMGLTIDAYGPISDNAGGIAEMAGLGHEVRNITDALDAAGNTTAAIGKGFAIGSAALVSLALFGAYTVRAEITKVDILDPWTFTGLIYGALMPYAFSALTMKSVAIAAGDMVVECMRQFPLILNQGEKPDYSRCIAISTRASLKQMILPGALVLLSPIIMGMMFGKNCTAALLPGALVSGIQLAISASNTGGAWDNAKKYIETGALGKDHEKGSNTHKNAVTGDTVGDPMKDTSGPSLNILVKLSAIVSLVFGTVLNKYFSNSVGGPVWLKVDV